jgi:hypothetical protein
VDVDDVVAPHLGWAQNYAILSTEHPLVLPVFPGASAARASGEPLRFASLADVRRHFKRPVERLHKNQAPLFARAANAAGTVGRRLPDLVGPWWVILDVDGVAMSPEAASARLSLFGVAHCIHTTWSHDPAGTGLHRYRVLTEFVAFERRWLEYVTRELFGLLGLKPTPESWNSLVFYSSAIRAESGRAAWRWCSELDTGADPWRPSPVPAGALEIERTLISAEDEATALAPDGDTVDEDLLREALARIPNVSRNEEWLPVGMALHEAEAAGQLGAGAGRALWDEWSAGQDYGSYSDAAQEAAWDSFRPRAGGIGVGTIIHLARQNGWEGRPMTGPLGERADAADDFAEDAPLHVRRLRELNQRYAFAPQLNAVMAVNAMGGDDITALRFQAFELLENDLIPSGLTGRGNPARLPAGSVWLRHYPGRRVARAIDYWLPDGPPAPEDSVNLWRGWQVEPGPGEPSLFLAHLRDVVCRGNDEHYRWALAWMAHLMQHPSEKPGTAIVLRGTEGIGKSFLGNYLGAALGQRLFHPIVRADELTGRFNALLAGKLLLLMDEVSWGGRRANGEDALIKTLVTEPRMTVEQKHVKSFEVRSFCRLIFCTNEEWAVRAGPNARRFMILDPDPCHRNDTRYWDALGAEMKGHGPAALVRFLQGLRLEGLPDPRKVLETAGLSDLKELTLGPVEELILEALETGLLTEHTAWPEADGAKDFPPGAWVDQQLLGRAFGLVAGTGKYGGGQHACTRRVKKVLHRIFGALPERRPHGKRQVRLPELRRAIELFRSATGVHAGGALEIVEGIGG